MNVRQLLNDTYELIDTLKTRYGHDQVILAGHSFGSYLGSILVSERPELFSAYISIGQVVDDEKAHSLQRAFIIDRANQLDRTDVIQALESQQDSDFENWLFEFGGELKNSTSFLPLLWSGLRAPEYTLAEAKNVGNGSSFSSMNMNYNVLSGSIYDEIEVYDVPVYFLIGRNDYTTPHALVAEYHEMITAPHKELIYFENSSHFPFFEEPEQFCSAIKKVLNTH